jgi:uncharacterized protein
MEREAENLVMFIVMKLMQSRKSTNAMSLIQPTSLAQSKSLVQSEPLVQSESLAQSKFLVQSTSSSTSNPTSNPMLRRSLTRLATPLLIGVLTLMAANPAFAEAERMLRTITVTGQGTESIQTTQAQVMLAVEVQGKTAEEVQREAARRTAAVVEFLRSRNVNKLQTTGIYLSPQYDYNNNTQRITGYTANNSISFRVPTDKAGALMDEAISKGATRIDGVNFSAEDSAIATAQQQALKEAAQDAQTQADAVLSALGLSKKDVVSIQVNGATPTPVYTQGQQVLRAEAAPASPTPVVGGEQEVQASVTLQISY